MNKSLSSSSSPRPPLSSSPSSSSLPSKSNLPLITACLVALSGVIVLVLWATGVLFKKSSAVPSLPTTSPGPTAPFTLPASYLPDRTFAPSYLPTTPNHTSGPTSRTTVPTTRTSAPTTRTSAPTLPVANLSTVRSIVGSAWQGTVPFVFPGNLTRSDESIFFNNAQSWQCGWLCTADENDHSGIMLFSTQADGSWVMSGGMWDMAHLDPKTSTLVFDDQPSDVFTVTVLGPDAIVFSRQVQPGVSTFYVIRP